MSLTPNEDRVFVEPIPDPETTKSGIIIPEVAKGKHGVGRVVAAGPASTCQYCGHPHEITLPADTTVIYPVNAGYEFELDGRALRIIRFSDIWGIDKDNNH